MDSGYVLAYKVNTHNAYVLKRIDPSTLEALPQTSTTWSATGAEEVEGAALACAADSCALIWAHDAASYGERSVAVERVVAIPNGIRTEGLPAYIGKANTYFYRPALVHAKGEYLAVWEQSTMRPDYSGFSYHVVGKRFRLKAGAKAEVLADVHFCKHQTDLYPNTEPAAGYDGKNFFVAWRHLKSKTGYKGEFELMGAWAPPEPWTDPFGHMVVSTKAGAAMLGSGGANASTVAVTYLKWCSDKPADPWWLGTPAVQLVSSPATHCGNGVLDPGEQCEGANLNGKSCVSLGWKSGSLGCNADCTFFEGGCE